MWQSHFMLFIYEISSIPCIFFVHQEMTNIDWWCLKSFGLSAQTIGLKVGRNVLTLRVHSGVNQMQIIS